MKFYNTVDKAVTLDVSTERKHIDYIQKVRSYNAIQLPNSSIALLNSEGNDSQSRINC